MTKKSILSRIPLHGWAGLILMITFWVFNWNLTGFRTQWGFFPQWLGFCLLIDGLTYARKGNSLLSRSKKAYIGLFLLSAPSWWLFELIDLRADYWIYQGSDHFTDLEFFLLATLSFSTVIPAMFGTTEFLLSFKWPHKVKGPIIKPNKKTYTRFYVVGFTLLIAFLIWPEYLPAFVWMFLYFIIEPFNAAKAKPNFLIYTSYGNWMPVLVLWIASLICGFFWEMWNFYSYPRWIYDIGIFNFGYIFEMPVLGYLGYLPFSLELFAMYHLASHFMPKIFPPDYLFSSFENQFSWPEMPVESHQ